MKKALHMNYVARRGAPWGGAPAEGPRRGGDAHRGAPWGWAAHQRPRRGGGARRGAWGGRGGSKKWFPL